MAIGVAGGGTTSPLSGSLSRPRCRGVAGGVSLSKFAAFAGLESYGFLAGSSGQSGGLDGGGHWFDCGLYLGQTMGESMELSELLSLSKKPLDEPPPGLAVDVEGEVRAGKTLALLGAALSSLVGSRLAPGNDGDTSDG